MKKCFSQVPEVGGGRGGGGERCNNSGAVVWVLGVVLLLMCEYCALLRGWRCCARSAMWPDVPKWMLTLVR